MGIGQDKKHLENTDGPGISENRKIIGSLIHVPSAHSCLEIHANEIQ